MTDDVENQVVSKKLFHATIDDESTRTFVDEKIRLRWTEGDLISLFEGTTRNKKYKFLGETGDNAGDFEDITTGFGSGNDIDRYYAIYPYSSTTKLHEDGYITYTFPAEQNYAENSFGLGANPMVAVTGGLDDFDLCFRNAAGYLRLYLYGDDVAVKSIKIEGNNSEPLAGKAYITPEFGGFPTTEMDETATASVTLNCGEGVKIGSTAESSTPFWVVLPPTTFAEGFTLTITDTNDNEFTKSFTSNVNIQRNKYISAKLEVEFSNSHNKQILYTATSKVEPYSPDGFGANIFSNEWNETTGEGVITFDGEVTSIGEYAFGWSDALTSITIPDSVTAIGNSAFICCYALTSVTIGNGVASIGEGVFTECNALTSITIPDSVASVGNHAFDGCYALASVTIGNSVTSIGDYAFNGCNGLTSITIPDSVTSIGKGAFSYCPGLNSFYGKFTSDDNRCLIIDGELKFFAPAGLTTYNIPDDVTQIGVYAFVNCDSLASVTIGSGVTEIGGNAFYDCDALTSITIPDSVTSIGERAFHNCNSLANVTISDGVTSIGNYAFYDCDALTSITIPNSVISIGGYAFAYCDSLASVTIGNGVTSIGNGAFLGCVALSGIAIPNSVTTIGDRAFYYCSGLKSFNGKYASNDNRCLIIDGELKAFAPAGLELYDIPDGVTSIGKYAFNDCDTLLSITIPDSTTTIVSGAFEGCNSLASVTIGSSVTTIGNYTFYDSRNLQWVYCKATTPPDQYEAFSTLNLVKIYVPSSSVDVYKAADGWAKYADKIVGYNF